MRERDERGVTIIEMLVVVTVIGLFAGLVGVKYLGRVDQAKHVAAKTQINTFVNALTQHKLDHGTFPSTEQGLAALRPYLSQDVPTDPWNRAYVYRFPGEHGSEPDILSLGADGQPGGVDEAADIVSWKSK